MFECVCCNVCVVESCSVLQCVTASRIREVVWLCEVCMLLQCVCCNVCVAVYHSVLQCAAALRVSGKWCVECGVYVVAVCVLQCVCCNVCVAVCCSVLQCAAVA